MRRRHRPLPQRLLFIVAGLLSVVVLLGSVGGFVVVKWFDGSIARVKLNLGQDRPGAAPIGSENWLLVGTDSRAGSSGEFGSGIIGARSDTTILTHLDADGTTTNISIPRDTLVTIPAYTIKGVSHPAHKDKFNAAIYDGGPSLLVRTVEKLFNVQVDHYVSVDLEGFKKISEVINGVQVCIKPAPASANEDGGLITNINDGYSGFHGRYGEQTLVGDQAVDFVRQRHGLPDSDLSRIKRQQQFLGSVFRTATRVNLLFNPVAVTRLLGAIQKALILDEGTSLTDLEKLGLRLRGLDPSKVFFETLPQRGLEVTDTDLGTIDTSNPNVPTLTPTGQDMNVGSVQIIQQPQFDEMVAKIRDAGTPTDAGTSGGSVSATNAQAVAVTVDPSQVPVTVEDGVGKVGLANQVTAALAKDAFPTGVPGPAATTGYATSQVRYGSGHKDEAQTVAAAVPGSVLVEDPSVTSGIVLVVGSNFTKVVPVSVSDIPTSTTPTPTPTATPSPNPAPISAASEDNRCTY